MVVLQQVVHLQNDPKILQIFSVQTWQAKMFPTIQKDLTKPSRLTYQKKLSWNFSFPHFGWVSSIFFLELDHWNTIWSINHMLRQNKIHDSMVCWCPKPHDDRQDHAAALIALAHLCLEVRKKSHVMTHDMDGDEWMVMRWWVDENGCEMVICNEDRETHKQIWEVTFERHIGRWVA